MLARTLRVLRERAGLSQAELQEKIGFSDSHVSRIEKQKASVDYDYLEKYQLLLSVPNSIILGISHVAAMTRDAKTARSAKRRAHERAKLRLLGAYFRNLSDRIAAPHRRGHPALHRYPAIDYDDPDSWSALLRDLMEATQNGHDPSKPTVFQDLDKLEKVIRLTKRKQSSKRSTPASVERKPNARARGGGRATGGRSRG